MENDANDKIKDAKIEEGNDPENFEEQVEESDDIHFIQVYIERKKLQNRILKEIIDNIKHTDKE